MAHTLERCEHEGIKWFPRVTIEKYSPDQSAWAERKLREELSWGRRLLVARFGIRVPVLHGDWLREVFREPEDGYARAQGNMLVATGLANISYLLLGTAQSGANGTALTNAQTVCGVGSTSTTATAADTHLGADGTAPNGSVGAYYKQMDSTGGPYPTWAGSGTANGGQINGQCTYVGTEANLNWVEWCWATGRGTITAGSTLGTGGAAGSNVFATASSTALLNHWTGTSLGTKGSGATWVFSTTITLS